MLRLAFGIAVTFGVMTVLNGQGLDMGRISGSVQANTNFFMKDESIFASGTPQYETQLYSADAWLNVNYSYKGFNAGVRLDVFNNSYLLNPTGGSYTAIGIGNWFVSQQIDKLNITGGYIYDQIGSGIIYRAYEERPLAIDNALFGLRATYDLTPDWKVKAFTGKQKKQLETHGAVIKGASVEGYIQPGNPEKTGKWSLAPGAGIVARTLDNSTTDAINNVLKYYGPEDSIYSYKTNTYALSLYNTLNIGPLSWYVEGAYKTHEVMNDPFSARHIGQDIQLGKYVKEAGTVIYTALTYADHGLGITIEGKHTKNFSFRTDPTLLLNNGLVNFIPALSRVNTYRLTSRYNPATQFMGEFALQVDAQYAINDKVNASVNYAHIDNLEGALLYREIFGEMTWKPNRDNSIILGLQRQVYNQFVYEGKVGVPNVKTYTPFAEYLHRFTRTKSLRMEASAMFTDQDYGSWVYGLAEFAMAPHWSFVISDMYNYGFNPEKTSKANNYPSLLVFYTQRSNRFSLGYIKQVEGIVCTGGICRYEPAFSGVRATLSSTF